MFRSNSLVRVVFSYALVGRLAVVFPFHTGQEHSATLRHEELVTCETRITGQAHTQAAQAPFVSRRRQVSEVEFTASQFGQLLHGLICRGIGG